MSEWIVNVQVGNSVVSSYKRVFSSTPEFGQLMPDVPVCDAARASEQMFRVVNVLPLETTVIVAIE